MGDDCLEHFLPKLGVLAVDQPLPKSFKTGKLVLVDNGYQAVLKQITLFGPQKNSAVLLDETA